MRRNTDPTVFEGAFVILEVPLSPVGFQHPLAQALSARNHTKRGHKRTTLIQQHPSKNRQLVPRLSGNPQTQWNINLGQALTEELKRKRELSLCKMCHKNPAEYSGYCGDCYNKLESDKKTKKATKHSRLVFPILHLFDTR